MKVRSLAALPLLLVSIGAASAAERPNVVWIVVEDMSASFGCYGETSIKTPHVDALAKSGVRFTHAVTTAPVCSAARSALITGMYQTSIGAHHHRSGRGEVKIHLPEQIQLVPQLFKDAGYLTNNLGIDEFTRSPQQLQRNAAVGTAKTDYNFEWDAAAYDTTHWAKRASGQPFFVQVQLRGGKLRGKGDGEAWPRRAAEALGSATPLEAVKLPPYLPADPVILRDWAQYLDAVRYTDWEVGQIVERLRQAGDLENTYIFFITDHGISHVRNKQFCYDGGVHIPLIVRGPGIEPGSERHDVVEHIDLAAASLALAGIGVPKWMQARDILAKDYQPRQCVFSARDRCDETVDRIRSVRSEGFKYIRNLLPQRPYLQPNVYKDGKPIVQAMRRLHAAGELNADQAKIMADARPKEELYDLQRDPFELHNLAEDPAHQKQLAAMRAELDGWIKRTGDRGQQPEPEAQYDSDMAVYLDGRAATANKSAPDTRRNIALMKQWASQGK
jgi:arylsulfatase A-like enzyme